MSVPGLIPPKMIYLSLGDVIWDAVSLAVMLVRSSMLLSTRLASPDAEGIENITAGSEAKLSFSARTRIRRIDAMVANLLNDLIVDGICLPSLFPHTRNFQRELDRQKKEIPWMIGFRIIIAHKCHESGGVDLVTRNGSLSVSCTCKPCEVEDAGQI